MISKDKEKIDLKFWCLSLFIIFTFIDNHSALFISDYYIPLIIFAVLSIISKPIKKVLTVNYKSVSFLVLLIIILLGTLTNYEECDKGTLLSYLVWFVFLFFAMNDEPNLRTIHMLMRSFVIGSIIISLMVIILRQNYYSSTDIGLRYTIKFWRNVTIDPNYLSSYLIIGFGMSVYIALFTVGDYFKRKLYFVFSLIILFAIFMIGSRAGYVAVFVTTIGALSQLHKTGKGNRKILAAIAVPVILALLVVLLPMILPEEILHRFRISSLFDTSNSLRISHWMAAIECSLKKPILGYGAMHTMDILQEYSSHRGVAHNTYLTFMLHIGIPGTLIIICIMLSIFRKIHNMRDTYWLFFFIGFVFLNCIVENHLGITFWLPILLLVYILNYSSITEDSTPYKEE